MAKKAKATTASKKAKKTTKKTTKTKAAKESKADKKVEEAEVAAKPVKTKKSKKEEKASSKAEIKEAENKVQEEIENLGENFSWDEIADAISTLDFFVDHRSDDCSEKGCDNLRTTQQYCRLHYISNWHEIKRKREILKEGRLQEYIEELIAKYPPKFIEAIVSDLQDEKEFYKALSELNIASELEFEDDYDNPDSVDDDDNDDVDQETRSYVPTNRFNED
ncbi:MAG: hypothetical protein CME62_10470 [Halobacteriovoraceae bacterium]|nr:hypothetical protein [Halobacteriovoraceae bacterium]